MQLTVTIATPSRADDQSSIVQFGKATLTVDVNPRSTTPPRYTLEIRGHNVCAHRAVDSDPNSKFPPVLIPLPVRLDQVKEGFLIHPPESRSILIGTSEQVSDSDFLTLQPELSGFCALDVEATGLFSTSFGSGLFDNTAKTGNLEITFAAPRSERTITQFTDLDVDINNADVPTPPTGFVTRGSNNHLSAKKDFLDSLHRTWYIGILPRPWPFGWIALVLATTIAVGQATSDRWQALLLRHRRASRVLPLLVCSIAIASWIMLEPSSPSYYRSLLTNGLAGAISLCFVTFCQALLLRDTHD